MLRPPCLEGPARLATALPEAQGLATGQAGRAEAQTWAEVRWGVLGGPAPLSSPGPVRRTPAVRPY